MQVIAACISLRKGQIPPTVNYEYEDPQCDLDYVPRHPRSIKARGIMVNSHGVGRVNSSLVLNRVE
jgi:3-oxoacyl-[acyl-carrier-protein] synthase II